MMFAFGLVSAAGYLAYNSLSSIVSSIRVKSRPDMRLMLIRDLTSGLDKAENSVRLYRLTQNKSDIKPYYKVIDGIDEKIDSLRSASVKDTQLLARIDTISLLIEDNMIVWNNMIDLYHTDSLDIYIDTLTAKIAVGTLNKEKPEKNILRRVFSRKAIKDEARMLEEQHQQELIRDLNKIEKQDSIKRYQLLETETKLAETGHEIRERLYMLISRMEHNIISSINENSRAADQLALKTYRWLAYFALFGVMLIFAVLWVVIRYVRKTREYQKALEKSKEETEKLANTKELFMANMSHELRTPVNAIYGFSEQLEHEALNEPGSRMLGIIKSASTHLLQIVNDILDYSKLQNAKIELVPDHFMPEPLFEELRLLLSGNAQEHQSQLNCMIHPSVPKVLYGDAHRLKQILFNLIGNACKFTHKGMITFSAEASEITQNGFDLIINVKDTGIGIPADMQSKVFEDFTQADAGTSRKYGGTGLGLSIVKKLVELHKGSIHLVSEEGKGTEITCILPYQTGDENKLKETEAHYKIPESVRKLRVLIADDEAYNRMLFKTIFSRWRVYFEEADNGISALEKIQANNFDLVFMDARMPEMDGITATKMIRNQMNLSAEKLPVICTSATHSTEDMKTYLDLGMNDFLPKPFSEQMLLEILLKTVPSERFNTPPVHTTPPDVGQTANTGKVNLSNLYHLANNDLAFIRQMLQSFIISTEEGIETIQNAVKTGDFNLASDIAHKISSPCRHVGAIQMYDTLKMIEGQALNPKNIGKLAKLSEELSSTFVETKKELEKHLETL